MAAERAGSAVQRYILRRLPWLVALLAILAVALLFAHAHWTLELISHFQFYYALLALLILILSSALRQWKWVGASLLLMAWFARVPVSYWFPVAGGAEPKSGERTRMLISFNLLFNNPQKEAVREALAAEDADFVLLLEASPEWERALRPWAAGYPHQLKSLADDPFGIWFLSKAPLDAMKVEEVERGFPTVQGHIEVDGKRLRLAGVHPVPPGGDGRSELQSRQFEKYRRLLEGGTDEEMDATILAGDLNATPFASQFQDLTQALNLHDAARGFGWRHTWSPVKCWPLGLPIDYVLVSKNIAVHECSLGPPLGSDHRWVKVRFVIR